MAITRPPYADHIYCFTPEESQPSSATASTTASVTSGSPVSFDSGAYADEDVEEELIEDEESELFYQEAIRSKSLQQTLVPIHLPSESADPEKKSSWYIHEAIKNRTSQRSKGLNMLYSICKEDLKVQTSEEEERHKMVDATDALLSLCAPSNTKEQAHNNNNNSSKNARTVTANTAEKDMDH